MSEMIDRLAKIIDPVAFGTYPDDDIDPRHGAKWSATRFATREIARGCIKAMREPTDDMFRAGLKWPETDLEGQWHEMIDEALK